VIIHKQNIDFQLIQAAKQGSQQAFTTLFTRYYRRIFNFIHTIIRDTTDVEDLTIVTFEKAFAKIAEYEPLCEFQSWLFKIAKHTCFDFIAYQKRRPANVDISDFRYLESAVQTPEQQLISTQTVYIIEDSIREMPFMHQRIIDMRDHGLLCRQIAKKLNVSISTVVGQIRYARLYLSKILTKKQIA
jgi:RNA polymerase sigma-70 factor (ECF subfamily)